MKNWTVDELIKYKEDLYKKLEEAYHMKKWYHSRKTKRCIDGVKYSLLTELIDVNRELTLRGIRK